MQLSWNLPPDVGLVFRCPCRRLLTGLTSAARSAPLVRSGRFRLVVSTVLEDELARAPDPVRGLLDSMRQFAEPATVEPQAMRLRDAYISAGILTRKWEADALHVAIATVAECEIIVSWNFKHIVHFDKVGLYNGLNLSLGFGAIKIHAPPEVIHED